MWRSRRVISWLGRVLRLLRLLRLLMGVIGGILLLARGRLFAGRSGRAVSVIL